MKRVIIFSILIIIILLSTTSFFMLDTAKKNITEIKSTKKQNSSTQSQIFEPFKATFTIYTNGTKRDFSDPKYHNLSKDVYITPSNPEEINIHKKDITWKDFFDTLPPPFMLTSTCLTTGTGQNFCITSSSNLIFFLNKTPTPGMLLRNIEPNDSLIIVYGPTEDLKSVLGESTSTPSSILNQNKNATIKQ